MATLEEVPEWQAVYQIERTDPVLGGVDGVANKPLKNLTNRTAFLKQKVDSISAMLDLLFPVGHMIISRNPANPADCGYPGTWRREADDFSLISTTNNSQLGQIAGENNPVVPVPLHGHSASASSFNHGTKRTTTSGRHSHSADFKGNRMSEHKHPLPTGGQRGEVGHGRGGTPSGGNNEHGVDDFNMMGYASAGIPTGSVSVGAAGDHFHDVVIGAHGHTITVNGTGTSNARLDVRGRCMKVAVWTRIS